MNELQIMLGEIFQRAMCNGIIGEYDHRLLAEEYFEKCLLIFFESFIVENVDKSVFFNSMNERMSRHTKFLMYCLETGKN